MRIYEDKRLFDFDFWGGARITASVLEEEEFDSIEVELEEMYPEGISDVELNDIFWFETNWIANMCNYEDFYKLCEERAPF